MPATTCKITAVEMPAMKLPAMAVSAIHLPAIHTPAILAPAATWAAAKWSALKLPAMKWPSLPWSRAEVPAPALAVLDRFAGYRMPDLARKMMLPLVLAIGLLLLSMIRVEFLPAQGPALRDVNGPKFVPVTVSEQSSCHAQSWPNFSADCIKSPTQIAAARRVDVR